MSFFLELDHKLFRKGVIRVRVRHDVTKLILLTEVVCLVVGVKLRSPSFMKIWLEVILLVV